MKAKATPARRPTKPVTRQRSTQEEREPALEGGGEDLRSVLAALGDYVAVCDADGRILEFSASLHNLAGESPAEIAGRTLHDLFPVPEADLGLSLIRQALDSGQPVHHQHSLKFNSREKVLDLIVAPISGGRVAGVARDITEQRQLENLSEIQRQILELIATGVALQVILAELIEFTEARSAGTHCSVFRVDASGEHLRAVLAPNLPVEFVDALDGLPIGPEEGSCGTAAFRKELVAVADIARDPLWDKYRALALKHGFRACWSKPVMATDGRVLGTFSMYYREPRAPASYDLQLLESAAYLASIAIERQAAEDALWQAESVERGRAAELEAVRGASLSLTQNLSFAAVLDELLRAVFRLMADATNAYIFLYDAGRDLLTFGAARDAGGKMLNNLLTPRPAGLTHTVAHSGRMIVVNDMRRHPLYVNAPPDWQGAIIGLPLKISEQVVGVMNIAYEAPRTFVASQLHMLELLADHAAIAIENARLFEAEHKARQQAEALREVAAGLDPGLGRVEMLDLILEKLARVVEYDSASIMLTNKNMLTMTAHRGLRPQVLENIGRLHLDATEHVQEVVATQRPVIIRDTLADSRWQYVTDVSANYIRCWLGAPLIVNEVVIGVLNLDKAQPGYYTAQHASLALAFANQAAVVIEHAQLYDALARETQQLALLNELGRDLSARLDPEQVYQAIYRATKQLMPCDAFILTLLAASGDEVDLVCLIDKGERYPAVTFPADRGLSGKVIASGKSLRIDNIAQFESLDVLRLGGPDHSLSLLMVPMFLGQRVIGTLSAQSYQEYSYTDLEEQTLSTLAYQAAIAIENARLYVETERRLRDQSLLYECSQALALVHDAASIIAAVAERIVSRFDATALTYYSYDPAAETIRVDYEYFGPGATERERQTLLGQTSDLRDSPNVSEAIRARQPRQIRASDPGLTETEGKMLADFDGKSVIFVPLARPDAVVGYIEVWNSRAEYEYSFHDKRLLAALGAQAATALDNARLYTETRRKSVELATLLESAEATSSATGIDELLNRLARHIATATDAVGCTISKWDKAADAVMTWMTWRQRGKAFADSPGAVYPLSRFPATREVLEKKQPIYISVTDALADPGEVALMEKGGLTNMLMLPLIVGDNVIGLVEVYEDSATRRFAANEIDVVEGMANQAALAIANAQLFEDLGQEKRRLELLYNLSHSIADTLDPFNVGARALTQICATFDAFQGAIYIVPPGTDRLQLVALTGVSPDRIQQLDRAMNFRIGMGVSGWVAQQRVPIIVDDVKHDARWIPVSDLDEHVRSLIAAPLIAANVLVGVINLSGGRRAAFRPEQIPLLTAAAATVAAALRNAQLFDETRRHADEVTAASAILHALNASPEVTEAFPAIVTGIRAMAHCERVSLALLDDARERVSIAVLDKPRAELNRGESFPLEATSAAVDILAGRPHLTPDMAQEIDFPIEKRLYEAGHRSRINLPLRTGTQVIGALNLLWPQVNGFARLDVSLMSQMADALALAIEKNRLADASRRRDAILESLAYGSQCLLTPGSLDANVKAVLASLGPVVGVSRAYVFENHQTGDGVLLVSQRYEWCAAGITPQIDNPRWQKMPYAADLARWAELLGRGQPLFGLTRDFPDGERLLLEVQDILSIVVAPIFSGGRWWGFLGFDDCAQERRWAAAEIETLKNAAAMLGVAFARQSSETAEREQRALAEALRDTASALNSTLKLDEVLDRILENVGRVAPHEAATIMMIDAETRQARVARGRGYLERGFSVHQVNLPILLDKASNLLQMIETGKPCIIADVLTFPDWVPYASAAWVRSYLGAPISVRGQTIGFINLDSSSEGFFTQTHAEHLQAFASEAAVALDNARLFAATEQHARHVSLLNEIAQAVLEASSYTDSLQILADRLGQLIQADGCYITIWDEARQMPIPTAAFGLQHDRYPTFVSRSLPNETTLTASVLKAGRPLIIEDVHNSLYISPRLVSVYSGFPLSSVLALPLIVGEQKLGAVLISFGQPHRFSDEEITLSEQAAAQVALAIFKGRLAETEREQRLMAEALRDTASALNSTLNFDDVLDRILDSVGRVMPHDAASIMLADDPARSIDPNSGVVQFVRSRGYLERGLKPYVEDRKFNVGTLANLKRMVETRRPVVVPDTHADPEWVRFPEVMWVRSYIGAPIEVKGWIIGFINLDSTAPRFFAASHADRLQVFADQAAIAIENSYLYDSIRQNADELSVLYRASEQLINPGADLATVAAQIASMIVREFQATHCAVLMLDDASHTLQRVAQMGDAQFDCSPVVSLDGSDLIAAVVRSGEVAYAPDAQLKTAGGAADPESRPFTRLVTPLQAGGRLIGVLSLESQAVDAFDDRTRRMILAYVERAGLALENTQLLTNLVQARQVAEEANQLKSEFLANTSHELRTPLTAIIASLSMVVSQMCDSPEEERELAQIAYTASEHLLEIINNVLDIAKVEAGRMEVRPQILPLRPLFSEIYALTHLPADEKQLNLELYLPDDPDAVVWADPERLRQIMLNLIFNAIKFTERGGIVIRVQPEGNWMQITVTDSGIGIPPEKQAKLFQPFVQADGTMTRKYGGTGLGLSISRRLAELMGGSLSLFSEGVDRGTTLTLKLPLAQNGTQTPERPSDSYANTPSAPERI